MFIVYLYTHITWLWKRSAESIDTHYVVWCHGDTLGVILFIDSGWRDLVFWAKYSITIVTHVWSVWPDRSSSTI